VNEETLLILENLKKYFSIEYREKGLFKKTHYLKAVDSVNLEIFKGETLGLVGESGCGKTTIGKMIVKLITPTSGKIVLNGKSILSLEKRELSEYYRKVQIIFQDPYSSLDPRFTVGRTIMEPLIINRWGNPKERKAKVVQLMLDVGLREEYFMRYPHEFSGGQRQRIGVARALALNPDLVVCDEPVSALDVSIQAQILNLMVDLQEKYKLTYLFISHDLGIIKHVSNRIAVMYLGKIVELADNEKLFSNTLHPYTKALLNAIPKPNPKLRGDNMILQGELPSPINTPSGCSFHPRCPYIMDICRKREPEFLETEKNHKVKCHLYS
jgi:oligopeptide/dipeptide ABC transporter ATP-binding protein